MVLELLTTHLQKLVAARRKTRSLSAWNVGRCVREGWYTVHEVEGEPLQPRALMVFDLGDRVEDAVLEWLIAAGVPLIRTNESRDTTTIPEVEIRVRPDAFIDVNGEHMTVEIKSMSNFGFDRADRGELDESYLIQVECEMRGFGTQRGIVIGYRKETSHLCEVVVERSDERWEKIRQNVALARGDVTPPRPYELDAYCKGCQGTGKTPAKGLPHKACDGTGQIPGGPFLPVFPCGYCAFKTTCWGELEFVEHDGKPRWRVSGQRQGQGN